MSTVPLPGGEAAVIWESLLKVKDVAGVFPKLTAVAPVKLVPEIVTLVPPAAGPEDGLTPVTVGAGGAPPMLYEPDVTGLGSEVVAADSVYEAAVEGLVMPLSTTLT